MANFWPIFLKLLKEQFNFSGGFNGGTLFLFNQKNGRITQSYISTRFSSISEGSCLSLLKFLTKHSTILKNQLCYMDPVEISTKTLPAWLLEHSEKVRLMEKHTDRGGRLPSVSLAYLRNWKGHLVGDTLEPCSVLYSVHFQLMLTLSFVISLNPSNISANTSAKVQTRQHEHWIVSFIYWCRWEIYPWKSNQDISTFR